MEYTGCTGTPARAGHYRHHGISLFKDPPVPFHQGIQANYTLIWNIPDRCRNCLVVGYRFRIHAGVTVVNKYPTHVDSATSGLIVIEPGGAASGEAGV